MCADASIDCFDMPYDIIFWLDCSTNLICYRKLLYSACKSFINSLKSLIAQLKVKLLKAYHKVKLIYSCSEFSQDLALQETLYLMFLILAT